MEVKATLQKLLKKIATENEYEDFSIEEKARNGGSLTSYYFFVKLCIKGKKELQLFLKVAGWTEKLREVIPLTCPFMVELHFYRTVREKYQMLEDINGVPDEYRFRMPKFYGSSDEYLSETVAIEDLVAEGYEDFDRQNVADLEYMTTALALMAQFHALSLAYFQHDPDAFAETRKLLTMDFTKMESWLKTVLPKMKSTACEAAETHKDKLESYLANSHIIEQGVKEFHISHNHNSNIIVHGDFKPSNLMHRRRNGKLEIIIIDFQMIHEGDPVIELLYFILTATDEKFRRVHYKELLDIYYDKLRTSLLRLHVDPEVYSEKTYRARLKECSMVGLGIAIAFLPVVLVDDSKAPKFARDDSDTSNFAVEPSTLFKERFNGILNNYVEWGLL